MEIVHVVVFALLLAVVACQVRHVIETKPDQCFKVHNPDQPQLYLNPRKPEYEDVFESCTQWLRENKNCLGLRTQNGEVIVIFCKGENQRRRPGCYKVINKDKREEVICQKMKQGCDVLATRSNLTVVVHCNPIRGGGTALGIIDVKDDTPMRQ